MAAVSSLKPPFFDPRDADVLLYGYRARGGKTATSDREATKPTTTTRPPSKGRPLALANPLPSGKQNSDDDSDENDEESEGEGSGEDGNAQASTSSQPGQYDTGRATWMYMISLSSLLSSMQTLESPKSIPVSADASLSRTRIATRRRPSPPSPEKRVSPPPFCNYLELFLTDIRSPIKTQKSPTAKPPMKWSR